MTLYHLTFVDLETSYDTYQERFHIGVFASAADAEVALREMKAQFARSEWIINRSDIGRCGWAEGFERFP